MHLVQEYGLCGEVDFGRADNVSRRLAPASAFRCPMVLMIPVVTVLLAAITSLLTAAPRPPSGAELRAMLESREPSLRPQHKWDSVFYFEERTRPLLRRFLRDGRLFKAAAEALALIGDPDDLRLIIRIAPRPRPDPFENRWAYQVASALLEPRSEKDWAFLRACAVDEYDDRWVDAGAIQTLKLIGSQRSLEILREVKQQNAHRARTLAYAIEYVQSNPPPLRSPTVEDLATKLAKIIKIGEWDRNRQPRYNERGDKALVDLVFSTSEDRLTYTATFHNIDGVWRLRGVRETLQELVMRLAVPATGEGEIPSPPVAPLPSPVPSSLLELLTPPLRVPPPPPR